MTTIEELQNELARLREEVRRLGARPGRAVSRRHLLRAAPMLAVGGAAAAFGGTPAAAAAGDPVRLGRVNQADGQTTEIVGTVALTADPSATSAVRVTGPRVLSPEGPIGSDGVQVNVTGPGHGLLVDVTDGSFALPSGGQRPWIGTGVKVQAERGSALVATTSAGSSSVDAVTIDYAGTSRALYAQSHNPANINGTVTGVNEGHGIGVWGEQRNSTGAGIGVVGVGGPKGRGSQFTGGVAQTRLVPSTASTHPTTGKTGDLFVDKSVRLWFCQKASAGSTPAVWKQIG